MDGARLGAPAPYIRSSSSRTSSSRSCSGTASRSPSRSGGTSAESTPSCCAQVEASTPSPSERPFAPTSLQTERSKIDTTFAARACRCAWREASRSGATPPTATSRRGPTGRAQTTAPAASVSPPHRAAGPRDGDGLDDGAVPHAAAQGGSHPLRHFAASLRHLQRLPAAVVVEAVSPAAADLRSSARSEWCWIEPSASATRRSRGSGSPRGAQRRSGARRRARHGRAGSRRDATRDPRGRPWRRARRRGVRRARSRWPARPPSRRASPPSG